MVSLVLTHRFGQLSLLRAGLPEYYRSRMEPEETTHYPVLINKHEALTMDSGWKKTVDCSPRLLLMLSSSLI